MKTKYVLSSGGTNTIKFSEFGLVLLNATDDGNKHPSLHNSNVDRPMIRSRNRGLYLTTRSGTEAG